MAYILLSDAAKTQEARHANHENGQESRQHQQDRQDTKFTANGAIEVRRFVVLNAEFVDGHQHGADLVTFHE